MCLLIIPAGGGGLGQEDFELRDQVGLHNETLSETK